MAEDKDKEIEVPSGGWRSFLKTKRKILIIGGGLASALIMVGLPAVFMLTGEQNKDTSEIDSKDVVDVIGAEKLEAEAAVNKEQRDADLAEELQDGEERIGAIAPFETFLVNLSGGKYLRLQLQVEMEGTDVPRRFHARMVPIRDGIISLLTQKKSDELEDVKGKDGLKRAIRDLINEHLKRQDVKRVYFTQFVIQ
jgi:flagellar basal body-associated protein FliL